MIVLIFISILCGIYVYWSWKRNWRPKNEPPMFPGAWPLIGHAHLFIGDSIKLWITMQDLLNKCIELGGTAFFSLGPKTVYVITDPDDAITVANTCLDKDEYYDFVKTWLGDGLATSKQVIWKNHRKLLNPAFSQHVLDGFIEIFNKHARKLVRDLDSEVDKDPFDHGTCIGHHVMDTVCSAVLGAGFSDIARISRQYSEASENMYKTVVARFQNLFMHADWVYKWTGLKKKQDEYLKIMRNITDTVVQRKKSEMDGNVMAEKIAEINIARRFKPFLELLLELSSETNAFSDQQIKDHVNTIILGGHDTSTLTIMYTLLMLGSFSHVQDKVCKELGEVFCKSDRDVDKYDLSKLVYLEAVIKECLRVIPVGPIVARHVEKDVKLKNYTLSAGNSCIIALGGVNLHLIWGEDAQEFKPERWLDPSTLPAHPAAFGAFSFGKRNCIGKAYALMFIKTTLVHVLRHYKVKGDWTKMQLKMEVSLKPVSGHHIAIERRM